MTTEKTLSRLLAFAPTVLAAHTRTRTRCILATAVGLEVLRRFEVRAAPLPVTVQIINARALAALQAGVSLTTAIATGGHVMTPARDSETAPGQWGGHLLLALPSRGVLIDLDFQQFSRPAYGLTFREADLFDWPAGTRRREFDRSGGRVEIRATTDRRFETAADWTDPDRRAPLVAQLCRAIRCGYLTR